MNHIASIKSSLRDDLARDPGNLLHIIGSCRLGSDRNPLIRVVLKSASHSSDLHNK